MMSPQKLYQVLEDYGIKKEAKEALLPKIAGSTSSSPSRKRGYTKKTDKQPLEELRL